MKKLISIFIQYIHMRILRRQHASYVDAVERHNTHLERAQKRAGDRWTAIQAIIDRAKALELWQTTEYGDGSLPAFELPDAHQRHVTYGLVVFADGTAALTRTKHKTSGHPENVRLADTHPGHVMDYGLDAYNSSQLPFWSLLSRIKVSDLFAIPVTMTPSTPVISGLSAAHSSALQDHNPSESLGALADLLADENAIQRAYTHPNQASDAAFAVDAT